MLTLDGLRKAVEVREQIEELNRQLDGLLNEAGDPSPITPQPRPTTRRRMSDSGRRKIAKAQRDRWARVRASQGRL